jgi:hypothetical protein
MKLRLLFFCFLLTGIELSAQDEDDMSRVFADTSHGGGRFVISPDGLNLRAKPNRQSKTLQTVLFGEKVQVISPQHFGRDTVGQLEYFEISGKSYRVPIDGYWVKVRYRQKEGYMFSAYLGRAINEVREADKPLNQDFVLLFPFIGCFSNVFYQPGWHWYGVYAQDSATFMKKVKVSFYSLPMGLIGDAISTNDNRNLQFIIGSHVPLSEKTIQNKRGYERSLFNLPLFTAGDMPNDSLLQQYNLAVSGDNTLSRENYWDSQKLVFQKNGVRQEVLPPSKDGLWYLVWCGDLDGDGKDDYIIHFGEKSGAPVLYLSKPAGKGQLVKPVAIYYSGYCC